MMARSDLSPDSIVMEARGLKKSYRGSLVVKGLDLQLHRGEVLGLLGPNGAGKTTTVAMLYGAVEPSAGEIIVRACPESPRSRMGIVTQDNALDNELDVFENLLFFARYHGLVGAAAKRKSEELLTLLDLVPYRRFDVEALSGGLSRRLMLARALLNDPDIVFLDEPTTGLDPEARQEFWKVVLRLREEGRAVLLTTHYMDEAERLCDRLLLLQHGTIVDEGDPAALIRRIVGEEVVEVSGASRQQVEAISTQFGSWCRPFSDGFLIALPPGPGADTLYDLLVKERPHGLHRRRANLEDVFLVLTGTRLG